ncbi:patatin-like phospholipase family protein [Mycobacterium sp. NPDC051804]|uniref:patatin-like phospholipase family protein n=1 Tax=Mycobacterium sp. NPDC051804 TaxID=3364295 RepID=UPI00378C558B
MTKRALVLAGGGLAGIAWEIGILRGIADASPATAESLRNSDVLVGTSAGSAVAAQLISELSLDTLFEQQLETSTTELNPNVGIEEITELFLTAVTQPGSKEEKLTRIGAVALSTDTVPEIVRRQVIERRLPEHEWPERDLRISAIDTATGELLSLDRNSGVNLVDAVAASCAVPGVWPPVTIGGKRFMDGGVGSTVNLELAADCDVLVTLLPQGRTSPSPFGDGAVAEVDTFPGSVYAVFADDESLAAFGPNPLDPACRAPSAVAGREQGRLVAGEVATFLNR